MKFQKIGKTLEWGFYVALIAYAVLLVCRVVVGYVYLSTDMAGPVFYSWRKKYADVNASKGAYGFIDPNTEDDTKLLKEYISNVQSMENGKKLDGKKKDLNDKIKNYSTLRMILSWLMFSPYSLDGLQDELKKVEEKLKNSKSTVNGLTPLYSVGMSDSFLLGPKKTFKIFQTKGGYNEAALQAELDFLAYRLVFAKYVMNFKKDVVYDSEKNEIIKKDPKNWISLEKDAVEKFFKTDEVIFTEDKENNVDVSFASFKDSKSFKISKEQSEAVKRYIGSYDRFNEIIESLEGTAGSLVTFDEKGNSVIQNDSFLENIRSLIKQLGLSNLFPQEEVDFDKAVGEFIGRLAVVKPATFDDHILGRFYYNYLFTRSYLDPANSAVSENEDYKQLALNVESTQASLEKAMSEGKSSDSLKELSAKVGLYTDKLRKKRIELIFNDLSQKIAMNLGNKGYYLKDKDSTGTMMVMKYIYPSVFTESESKKEGSVFTAAS